VSSNGNGTECSFRREGKREQLNYFGTPLDTIEWQYPDDVSTDESGSIATSGIRWRCWQGLPITILVFFVIFIPPVFR